MEFKFDMGAEVQTHNGIAGSKFSMYVDAVEGVMGPSSYGGVRMPLPDKDSRPPSKKTAKPRRTAFAGW